MSDTISRQAAIDAVSDACFELRGVFGRCEDAIKALPSVQSERKTGRWIRSDNKLVPYYCSSCTGRFNYEWKFCPNCGAKMMKDGE